MDINKNTSIAVIGVSENPQKYGHKIFKDLLFNSYNVFAVNPNIKNLLNQKVYPSIDEINPKPELIITVVPPNITEKIILKAIELNIKNIWMQPGSESEKAIDIARKNNLNLIHNACFMIDQKIW